MSYILDALKKSEQERGHGGIPSVQTLHSSSLNYNDKKTYWPYILITAVLLNIVTIVYFVLDKDKPSEKNMAISETIATSETRGIEKKSEILPEILNITDNTQNAISDDSNKQLVKSAPITHNKASEEELNGSTTTYASFNDQPASMPAAGNSIKNDATRNTVTADRNTAEGNTNIIEFYDLPDTVKQQLPAIIISAHVYSTNPLQRSLVVNNNFLEEGEYFLDGLILHEITADGAIFNYKDIKFHIPVVSDWR